MEPCSLRLLSKRRLLSMPRGKELPPGPLSSIPILGQGISASTHVPLLSRMSHRVWGDLPLMPDGPFHIDMREHHCLESRGS